MKESLYQGEAVLWENEWHQEPAYQFFLATLDTVFHTLNSLRLRKLKRLKRKAQYKERIAFELARLEFFKCYLQDHLNSLNEGVKAFEKRQQALSIKIKQKGRLTGLIKAPEYRLNENTLSIQEPSLEVSIKQPFTPALIPKSYWPAQQQNLAVEALIGEVNHLREGQTLYFYADGTLKAEAFYQAGKLHGPWSFYNSQGIMLYRSWFIEGLKVGKSIAYYHDGSVYSITGYRKGLAQGAHLYYYEDGTLKTSAHYDEGMLHGSVKLYYSNGRLKKEQHFVKGQLSGLERIWNERGELTMEAYYKDGKIDDATR
jgi:antitoxin component YwqK of YwqJK toxin-antitoxin module